MKNPKPLLAIIACALLITACSGNDSKKSNHSRAAMISELRRFKKALRSADSKELCTFFSFPVSCDSLATANFIDSTLKESSSINADWMVKHFRSLLITDSDSMFCKLFDHVNLNALSKQDKIKKEVHIKGEGCYYNYSISIDGDKLELFYGTNTNEEMVTDTDDMVCGEFAYIWIFRLVNNRMVFEKEFMAG